jgi:hypothetical protein
LLPEEFFHLHQCVIVLVTIKDDVSVPTAGVSDERTCVTSGD